MSGGLFTNQLLRETAVEIESVERLRRAHARAYQRNSGQISLYRTPGARKLPAWLIEARIP